MSDPRAVLESAGANNLSGYLPDLHSETSLDNYHYTMCKRYGHVARLRGGMFGVSHPLYCYDENPLTLLFLFSNFLSSNAMLCTSPIPLRSTLFLSKIRLSSASLSNSRGKYLQLYIKFTSILTIYNYSGYLASFTMVMVSRLFGDLNIRSNAN